MGSLVDTAMRLFGAPAPVRGTAAVAALYDGEPGDGEVRYVAVPRPRAIGAPATLVTAGVLEETDPNTETRGPNWYGSPGKDGVGSQMMRDAHVHQSVETIIAPLLAGDWDFTPASDAPIDREIAAFCKYAFLHCLPWDRVIRSLVLGYVRDGFFLAEQTDDFGSIPTDRFTGHPGKGRAILPTAIAERPAWSITRFNPDPSTPEKLLSVQQYLRGGDAGKAGYVTIPADRILRFTWDQSGGNFVGRPILRSAYGPWKMKQIFTTIAAINIERYGVGLPVLTLSEDAVKADIDNAQTGLSELRANERGYWINPHGYELDIKEATNKGDGIEAAIARCNIDIAVNVAAGFMLLSLMSKTGSNALSGTQQGQHHLSMVGHAKFVASVFNFGVDGWSPVERIVRLNYGLNVAVPRLEVKHLPTRDWLDIVKQYFQGVSSGALTADDPTENEIRSILQLNQHDKDTARARGGSPATSSEKVSESMADEDSEEVMDREMDEDGDEGADKEASTSADQPDNTTPKEQQTIFGYHLQYGVAKINEARRNLNLPDVPYGEKTVPEFLASLSAASAEDSSDKANEDEPTTEEDSEGDE